MKLTTSRQIILPTRMESVRRRLERWRRNRPERSPIPEELWRSAAAVAGEYGVAKTARALRLNYYALKERLDANVRSVSPEADSRPAFVELVPEATVSAPECTVELEDASGARMRIHLKGIAMPEIPHLADAFWRARR